MIPPLIRLISKAICLVLIISFGMFVIDEMSTASTDQTNLVHNLAAVPIVRDAHAREINPLQTTLREKIDQVNDALTAPAEEMVADKSPWVMRTVPFILGLLLFGFGGHLLANFLAMSRSRADVAAALPTDGRRTYTPASR